MTHYYQYLLGALLTAALVPAHAQSVPFTSARIPNKELLKIAQRAIKAGEEDYKASSPRYLAALPHFLEAQKINPNNGGLNLEIGDCYLNMGDKATALPYLQKAAELETGPAASRAHYVLGRAYQLSAHWPEALKEFERARPVANTAVKKGQPTADAVTTNVNRRLAECKAGQRLMQHPLRLFVDNLGPTVNSPEDELNPLVTADESGLFLTSYRAGALGGAKNINGHGLLPDVYHATRSGPDWGPARTLNAPVNSNAADMAVATSADGQRLLLHADGEDGDLSETHLTASGWSKPHPLGSHINTKYRETSATFSPDGRYVYFVSDKPEGGLGGRDIYRAEIEGKTPPVNLGADINTPYDEEGVFMQPDGKTLLFSSQGHGTMGGFDVFKSVLENGKWSEPENLGWPLNTPDDDLFFSTTASGRYGYFASDRPGGSGGLDLYRVTFLGAEKQPLLDQDDRLLSDLPRLIREPRPALVVPVVTPTVTLLKGVVTDISNQQPVPAQLDVINNANGQTIGTFQTTLAGRYLLPLPSGINYAVVVHHDNFLAYFDNVNLPPDAGFAEARHDVRLQKMEPGSNVVLQNVFFAPGQDVLRPESTPELNRLVQLLSDNSRLKVHLAGHTDEAGSDNQNQDLSQRRVQVIMAYLVAHKIKAERLTATGYGATVPYNDTADGRKLSCRTEFKVMSR